MLTIYNGPRKFDYHCLPVLLLCLSQCFKINQMFTVFNRKRKSDWQCYYVFQNTSSLAQHKKETHIFVTSCVYVEQVAGHSILPSKHNLLWCANKVQHQSIWWVCQRPNRSHSGYQLKVFEQVRKSELHPHIYIYIYTYKLQESKQNARF